MPVLPVSSDRSPDDKGPALTSYALEATESVNFTENVKPHHNSSEEERPSTSKSHADAGIAGHNSDKNENGEDDRDVLEMAEQLLSDSGPDNVAEADAYGTEAGDSGHSIGEKRKLKLDDEASVPANEKLQRHEDDDDKSLARPPTQTDKPEDKRNSEAAERRADEESINGTSDIRMPAAQDESRAKEEDPRSGRVETTQPMETNKTKGDSNVRKDTSINQDEESDEEKTLDLASLNAFEYERVRQYDEHAIRRYEQYRRSDLKTAKVRKVLTALNPSLQKVSEHYIIAIKGLAKMFVGDVTEVALEVKRERGDKGALLPVHLREAYRRLRASGVFPTINQPTVAFP